MTLEKYTGNLREAEGKCDKLETGNNINRAGEELGVDLWRAKCLQGEREESSYIQFLNCSLVSDQIFI